MRHRWSPPVRGSPVRSIHRWPTKWLPGNSAKRPWGSRRQIEGSWSSWTPPVSSFGWPWGGCFSLTGLEKWWCFVGNEFNHIGFACNFFGCLKRKADGIIRYDQWENQCFWATIFWESSVWGFLICAYDLLVHTWVPQVPTWYLADECWGTGHAQFLTCDQYLIGLNSLGLSRMRIFSSFLIHIESCTLW